MSHIALPILNLASAFTLALLSWRIYCKFKPRMQQLWAGLMCSAMGYGISSALGFLQNQNVFLSMFADTTRVTGLAIACFFIITYKSEAVQVPTQPAVVSDVIKPPARRRGKK